MASKVGAKGYEDDEGRPRRNAVTLRYLIPIMMSFS